MDTLTSMNNLANLYSDRGRFEMAEVLYVCSLETRKAVLRDDHPDILTSMNNLGTCYCDQKRFDEAEDIYYACFTKRREVLGGVHPDTLLSARNLARVYYERKKYPEAEAILQSTLHSAIDKYGSEHQLVENINHSLEKIRKAMSSKK